MSHCAVIGAGAAGLAAARALHAAGLRVTVFDKGRRAGGRMASRSSAFGSFDHGAQFMRLRDAGLLAQMQMAQHASAAHAWPTLASTDGHMAWIGAPEMNALAQWWARDLDVRSSHTLVEIQGLPGARMLRFDDQTVHGPFSALIITAPAPQALAWLDAGLMRDALHSICYAPSLALMWVPTAADLPAESVFQPEAESGLAFIAREDLKPGRAGMPRYLVHASAAWSQTHLERPVSEQQQDLLQLAAQWLGVKPEARHLQLHRWRYALVTQAVGQPFLLQSPDVFYAGDGCLGGRVEAALLSGQAAAAALISAWDEAGLR